LSIFVAKIKQQAYTLSRFVDVRLTYEQAIDRSFLRAITRIACISYGNSVRLSQPSTDSSASEVETSGFHHVID